MHAAPANIMPGPAQAPQLAAAQAAAVPALDVSSSSRDDPAEQHPSPLPACLRPYLLRAQVCTTPRALSAVQQPLLDYKPVESLQQQQQPGPAAAEGRLQPQQESAVALAESRAADATTAGQMQLQGSACSEGPYKEAAATPQHPWDPSSSSSGVSAAPSQDEEPEEVPMRPPLHAVPHQQPARMSHGRSGRGVVHLCDPQEQAAGRAPQKATGPAQRRSEIALPLPGLPVQQLKQVRHVPRLLILSLPHTAGCMLTACLLCSSRRAARHAVPKRQCTCSRLPR